MQLSLARKHLAPSALIAMLMLAGCSGGGFFSNPFHTARPDDNPGGTTVPYIYGIAESIAHAQHWLFWMSGICTLLTVALAVLAIKFMPLLAVRVARDGAIASVGLFVAGLLIKPVAYICLFAAVGGLVYIVIRVAMNWSKARAAIKDAAAGNWQSAIDLWKQSKPDDHAGPDADVKARTALVALVNPAPGAPMPVA